MVKLGGRVECKDEEWGERLELGGKLWEKETVCVLSTVHLETKLIQWTINQP